MRHGAYLWTSENNLHKSVLFTLWVSGIELGLLDLLTNTFTS